MSKVIDALFAFTLEHVDSPKEYFDVLFGAQQKCNLNDFFAPVYIMNALVRSINSGKTEIVNRMGDI